MAFRTDSEPASQRSLRVRERGPLRTATSILFGLLLPFFTALTSTGPHAPLAMAHAAAPNFTLTDQFGRRFTLAEHIGHPLVLFFGYSHCGDVCPLTLAKLEHAKRTLGIAARRLQVVFVTVDPRRDTPAVLRRYVGLFDPSFIALTGSDQQLARACAAYHVRRRVLAPHGESRDYDVEHSAFLYFIGRDGHLRGFGDWSDSQQIVTQSISQLVSAPPPGQSRARVPVHAHSAARYDDVYVGGRQRAFCVER